MLDAKLMRLPVLPVMSVPVAGWRYRAGHYERDLTLKAGRVSVKVPKLKGAVFESAVIERYRRREESIEEAFIDMYLVDVSTSRVDDISQAL